MTAKVGSGKFSTESFAFGRGLVSLFVFSVLAVCMIAFVGCNEEQNKAVVDRDIPAAAKKAELQSKNHCKKKFQQFK